MQIQLSGNICSDEIRPTYTCLSTYLLVPASGQKNTRSWQSAKPFPLQSSSTPTYQEEHAWNLNVTYVMASLSDVLAVPFSALCVLAQWQSAATLLTVLVSRSVLEHENVGLAENQELHHRFSLPWLGNQTSQLAHQTSFVLRGLVGVPVLHGVSHVKT